MVSCAAAGRGGADSDSTSDAASASSTSSSSAASGGAGGIGAGGSDIGGVGGAPSAGGGGSGADGGAGGMGGTSVTSTSSSASASPSEAASSSSASSGSGGGGSDGGAGGSGGTLDPGPTLILTGIPGSTHIACDGSHIYWTQPGAAPSTGDLHRAALDGTSQELYAAGVVTHGARLVFDELSVPFGPNIVSRRNGSPLQLVRVITTSDRIVVSDVPRMRGANVAADSGVVFWVENPSIGPLNRVADSSGGVRDVGTRDTRSIVARNGFVYTSDLEYGLYRVQISTGNMARVSDADYLYGVYDIAANAQYVVWGGTTLRRARHTTMTPETLAFPLYTSTVSFAPTRFTNLLAPPGLYAWTEEWIDAAGETVTQMFVKPEGGIERTVGPIGRYVATEAFCSGIVFYKTYDSSASTTSIGRFVP
jgi:hypothetical protein